jgi:hypothetical protein
MKRYQVEITVTADGYIEIDADTPDEAQRRASQLEPEIRFGTTAVMSLNIDSSLFDGFGSVRVDRIEEVEEES